MKRLLFFTLLLSSALAQPVRLETIEKMPRIPQPLEIRDWKQVARDLDAVLFDFNAKGEGMPSIWWDKARRNYPLDSFALPAYLGDNRQNPRNPEVHEALTAMGAVLGASLVGIDKSQQNGQNYTRQLLNYFNKSTGAGVFLNRTMAEESSFWYDIFPNVVFSAVSSFYPKDAELEAAMRQSADRWGQALEIMAKGGVPNFSQLTYFDFKTMQGVDNRRWYEPDAAAGLAWLFYSAYRRFQDPKYLRWADTCMAYLQTLPRDKSPFYELLLSYGTLTAFRMNAEAGRKLDADKMLYWLFDGDSFARGDWGVLAAKWGNYDVSGLHGSLTDFGGYMFAFNSFNLAGSLAPIPRYDARYARPLGRWLLNLANSARLFYPKYLPDDNQILPEFKGAFRDAVAYEGLRKKWGLAQPYATSDARRFAWATTDFGLYGSVYVGMLGAIIGKTSDPAILEINLLATDFYHDAAYPSFLYYNPYPQARKITLELGDTPLNLYDAVAHKWVAQNVRGKFALETPPDEARVIVRTPVAALEQRDGKAYVGKIVVDYRP